MNRRSFLASILAAGVAPAFVGSSILMPVRVLWTPPEGLLDGPGPCPKGPPGPLLYRDGVTDDTDAFQAYINGEAVYWADDLSRVGILKAGKILVTRPLLIGIGQKIEGDGDVVIKYSGDEALFTTGTLPVSPMKWL